MTETRCAVAWCEDFVPPGSNSDKCDWHLLLELERKFRPRIADLLEGKQPKLGGAA